MPDYSYFYPKTLGEALKVLAAVGEVKVIAGGTELIPRIRGGLEKPGVLLDITGTGLDFIEARGNLLKIGAATPLCEVEHDSCIKGIFPALAEAASEIGGMQTRNLGTVGGNICTGVPSADLAAPLLAYGARARIRSLSGERLVPLNEFFLAPRRIAVGKCEMVTEIEIDIPANNTGSAFGKIGRRRAMRLAVVNAAACLELSGGLLQNVRLAMGTVSPVPLRLIQTEAFLKGREFSNQTLDVATGIMCGEISPRDSIRGSAEYRREIAAVLLKRTLSRAYHQVLAGGS